MTNPITDICIVADPYRCPPKFELLYKSNDRRDDCDLWRDGGVFRAKTSRYICISRAPTMMENGISSVVTDILIQNDREIPPFGYTLIEKTIDTNEKATKKKQIAIKTVPRNMTETAITEVIILSKTKHSPMGFVLAGEVNGLYICMKIGSVPAESPTTVVIDAGFLQPLQPSPVHSYSQRSELSSSNPSSRSGTPTLALSNGMLVMTSVSAADNYMSSNHINHSNTTDDFSQPLSPVADIPFQLHPKFAGNNLLKTTHPAEHFKTIADIENEYGYTFSLENSIMSQMPTCSG